MMPINIQSHRVVRIDGSPDRSAFRADTSCALIRGLNIDNKTGSFSHGESKPGRSYQDLPCNVPNRMVFERPPPLTAWSMLVKGRRKNANFHYLMADHTKHSQLTTHHDLNVLKFHSPTIAQTICTVNFILGLFASVTKLRLLACVFLCDVSPRP